LKSKINLLGKQLKQRPFDRALRNDYFITAKKLKKTAKQKKYQFKQNFIKKLLDASADNPQELWKLLRKAYSSKSHKENDDTFEPIDLMNHFQSQGDWKEQTDSHHESKIDDFLLNEKNYRYNDITDRPITVSEVKQIINSVKTGKSCGPDLILNEIIKCSCPVIVKSVTKLFNLIFSSGIYPKSWLNSYIVPIFKSGDPLDPNNYRGISLLNGIAKLSVLFSIIKL